MPRSIAEQHCPRGPGRPRSRGRSRNRGRTRPRPRPRSRSLAVAVEVSVVRRSIMERENQCVVSILVRLKGPGAAMPQGGVGASPDCVWIKRSHARDLASCVSLVDRLTRVPWRGIVFTLKQPRNYRIAPGAIPAPGPSRQT